MTDRDEPAIRAAVHAWMKHQGYTDDDIAVAETDTHEAAGCEFCTNHLTWDCIDAETGQSRHPMWDALTEAVEFAFFFADLGWRKVGADAETRTEWGVRRPTQHFGIKVDKARDEEHAREWVARLHDTEHVLNANPNAEVVSRTVTETAWTTPEEPR